MGGGVIRIEHENFLQIIGGVIEFAAGEMFLPRARTTRRCCRLPRQQDEVRRPGAVFAWRAAACNSFHQVRCVTRASYAAAFLVSAECDDVFASSACRGRYRRDSQRMCFPLRVLSPCIAPGSQNRSLLRRCLCVRQHIARTKDSWSLPVRALSKSRPTAGWRQSRRSLLSASKISWQRRRCHNPRRKSMPEGLARVTDVAAGTCRDEAITLPCHSCDVGLVFLANQGPVGHIRKLRRRGRVAEGGGLLNRYTLQRRIEG